MKSLTKLLMGAAVMAAFAMPAFAADTYKLDPMHTAVVFHINHFGFSNPSGKFMNADGTLVLDEKNPAASKVTVTFPIAAIDTGIADLDTHLKSKEFFDIATFPTATYASTSITVTGKDTAIVHGNLTLHGVTKPLDLNVKLNKIGENMFKKPTAGFTATATLKRSDYGITTYLPALSDEVVLDINSEANMDAPAAPAPAAK